MTTKPFGYFHLMLAALLVFALPACSAGGNPPGGSMPAGETGQIAQNAEFGQVPFPVEDGTAPARTVSGPAAMQIDGKDSIDESGNSSENGTARDFNAGPGAISWAIYRFDSQKDWHVLSGVSAEFSELPETYYLGIADFDAMQWSWSPRGTSQGGESAIDQMGWPGGLKGISPAGNCYLAVLFFDDTSATVNLAALGWQSDNNGPTADLAIDKAKGNASLQVSFDGSGSTDGDAVGISNYEWDWEGDGVFDESGPAGAVMHTYTEAGEYHPVLRVTDTDDGLMDTAQVTVTVQGWKHSFGNNDVEAFFAADSQQDDIYIVGQSVKNLFSDPDYDALLVSYDKLGNPRFQKVWGESNGDTFMAVDAIYGGGFVAVGDTTGFDADDTGMAIVRFDRYGNEVWARMWDTPGSDLARGVAVDFDGNIWVCGHSNGLKIGDDYDGILLHYNANGDLLHEKSISNGGSTFLNAMEVSLFNGLFVVGSSEAYVPGEAATVMNINLETANLNKEIALDLLYNSEALDLGTSPFGEVYITGTYDKGGTNNVLVAGINNSAEFAWVTGWEYGDFANGRGIELTFGQFGNVTGIYVGGDAYDQDSQSAISFLINLDPDGTYNSAKSWLASNGPISYTLDRNQDGAFLLAGSALKASATQSTIGYPPDYFITDTYDGTSVMQDVNATKVIISAPSVDVEGMHDSGGGGSDAWVTSFFPQDL